VVIWRDPLSPEAIANFGLPDRQEAILLQTREHGRITNSDVMRAFGVSKRTAQRDLAALVDLGILTKVGTTGKGTHYIPAKGAIKGS